MAGDVPNIKRRPEQFISDDRRVITRLFLPGDQERLQNIVDRSLRLSEEAVETNLAQIMRDFATRHRYVEAVFDKHAQEVLRHLDTGLELTEARHRLIGAYFTMESAIAAAFLLPSSSTPTRSCTINSPS